MNNYFINENDQQERREQHRGALRNLNLPRILHTDIVKIPMQERMRLLNITELNKIEQLESLKTLAYNQEYWRETIIPNIEYYEWEKNG